MKYKYVIYDSLFRDFVGACDIEKLLTPIFFKNLIEAIHTLYNTTVVIDDISVSVANSKVKYEFLIKISGFRNLHAYKVPEL